MDIHRNPLLILGDHEGMEIEAVHVLDGLAEYDVMVINRALLRWPWDVDYLATYHGECVGGWLRKRASIDDVKPIVISECGRFDVKHNPQLPSGGSAALGLHYANHLGYTKFLIAGINLDGEYARFFDGFVGLMLSMHRAGRKFKVVNKRLLEPLKKAIRGETNVL